MSKPVTNVQVRKHALSTFVANPLVYIYQKEKIAPKGHWCERAFTKGEIAIFYNNLQNVTSVGSG
jgi:hypothetical protein